VPPSGRQLAIRHGEQRATIVEVGGGIREYWSGGRAVLDPYGLEEMCVGAHGAALVPWPNRLGGGRYRFDGEEYQLPLSEPERGNAVHGLLRWRNWHVLGEEPSRVVVGTRLHPCAGYPFALHVEIAYSLGDGGLEVTTTATNVGGRACPYGTGQHPYLSPGEGLVDACTLELPASHFLELDERDLPTRSAPVEGSELDFRRPRLLGDARIDTAFTGLQRDAAGRCTVALTAPDGRRAELWVDRSYRYVEVFTGDTLGSEHRRRGLGTEPMTCPPNAFASGVDVVRLEPGQSHTARWGARLV
jgi:aldose 1-epimerase